MHKGYLHLVSAVCIRVCGVGGGYKDDEFIKVGHIIVFLLKKNNINSYI